MYTIDDEGLEEDGAVVGFAGQFVNHAGYLIAPRQRSDNRQRGTRVKDWGGRLRGPLVKCISLVEEGSEENRQRGGCYIPNTPRAGDAGT